MPSAILLCLETAPAAAVAAAAQQLLLGGVHDGASEKQHWLCLGACCCCCCRRAVGAASWAGCLDVGTSLVFLAGQVLAQVCVTCIMLPCLLPPPQCCPCLLHGQQHQRLVGGGLLPRELLAAWPRAAASLPVDRKVCAVALWCDMWWPTCTRHTYALSSVWGLCVPSGCGSP